MIIRSLVLGFSLSFPLAAQVVLDGHAGSACPEGELDLTVSD